MRARGMLRPEWVSVWIFIRHSWKVWERIVQPSLLKLNSVITANRAMELHIPKAAGVQQHTSPHRPVNASWFTGHQKYFFKGSSEMEKRMMLKITTRFINCCQILCGIQMIDLNEMWHFLLQYTIKNIWYNRGNIREAFILPVFC